MPSAFDPALLNVAFVFLLLGYGTKVGLAPLHAWLPDAHAEGPTPISAVLSGLLLNVALYALLRFKMLLAANPAALAPGPLMVSMGLVSLVFAAFMLYRRRDIKRLFAYSSIEHMGIITFAFGMGGPLANFAGLLHMTMHSLTKSAIFFAVGHIAQVKGTQKIADMGGLTETNPVLGWGLVLGVVAIAGLPPLGIFMSEFLVVSSTFARAAAARHSAGARPPGRRRRAVPAAERRSPSASRAAPTAKAKASYVPMFAHLALVLRRRHLSAAAAGRLVPERREAARMRTAMPALTDIDPREAARSTAIGRGRAWSSTRTAGARPSSSSRPARATLLGLWGDSGAVHMALLDADAARSPSSPSPCPDGTLPFGRRAASAGDPARARDPRPLRRSSRSARPTRGPGSTSASGACSIRSEAPQPRHRRAAPPTPSCRPRARACTRSRSVRCMPASSSPAISASPPMARRWCGSRSGSAMCTRASRRLMAGASLDAGRASSPAAPRATAPWPMRLPSRTPSRRRSAVEAPPRAIWLRALMAELERLANHFGDIGAICNDASFSLMHAHCGILRERTLARRATPASAIG